MQNSVEANWEIDKKKTEEYLYKMKSAGEKNPILL